MTMSAVHSAERTPPFFISQIHNFRLYLTEAEARRIHDLIPGANKKLMFLDSGHVLPVEYVSHAAKWLQDGLQ